MRLDVPDTAVGNIAITPITAAFTVASTQACAGIPLQFTDTSAFASSWNWNFGDGGTSTLKNPTHIFSASGNYTITLTVSYNGCSGTTSQVIYFNVTQPVLFTFSADDTFSCNPPLTVNFTNTSSGGTSYLWTFGDEFTSTLANPSHTYTTDGNYTVSLGISNSSGCVNTVTFNSYIVVGNSIQASFTMDSTNGCPPLTVHFTSTASTTMGVITAYHWIFGDGGSSNAPNPTHIYTVAGEYIPVLIVKNSFGCLDTIISSDTVKVGDALIPEFVANPLIQCVDQQISFTNLTQGWDQNTNWLWEFGDGSTSTLRNPTHAYSDTGIFSVTLIVINQGCSSDTERFNYILIIVPKAIFGFDFSCNNPTLVTFTDSSIGANTWLWEFGDGTTSTLQNPPPHTYPGLGVYTVTLTVTNLTTGCVDSTKALLELGTPVAAFGANVTSGCMPLTVHFGDSSAFSGSWLWDFGDSGTSTVKNPVHTYTDTGQYTVTLIVNPGAPCSDTIRKVNYITVYGVSARMYFTPSGAGCIPMTVNFIDSSTSFMGTIVNWKWYLGDDDSSTLQHFTYVYDTVGPFFNVLYVTDNHGCTGHAIGYISPFKPIPKFAVDTILCPGESVQFTNQTTLANTYFWNFGDGQTSTQTNPSHIYQNEGLLYR